ncbi:MAG: hypothetical protein WCX31_04990 [Salinivirgaceae bacterium]
MHVKPLLLLILLVNFITVNSQTNDTVITEKQYFINAHTLAANEFNDSLLKQYILLYPEGEYRDKALANIDIIAWQQARHKNTEESYRNYLTDFPNGKAIKLAQQKLHLINSPKEQKKE